MLTGEKTSHKLKEIHSFKYDPWVLNCADPTILAQWRPLSIAGELAGKSCMISFLSIICYLPKLTGSVWAQYPRTIIHCIGWLLDNQYNLIRASKGQWFSHTKNSNALSTVFDDKVFVLSWSVSRRIIGHKKQWLRAGGVVTVTTVILTLQLSATHHCRVIIQCNELGANDYRRKQLQRI